MNKPRTYTVDNVFNASLVGFDIVFKSKKNVSFLLEDMTKILVSTVILTIDTNSIPTYNPLLCVEYKSELSKYILKIPRGYYTAQKTKITQLISYLHNNCVIDNFSMMRTYLSFNDRELKTISKIQGMDIFKYVLCFDEKYINKFLPTPFENPSNMSVKSLIPYKGIIITPTSLISEKLFKVPIKEYYGVDLTDYSYGTLKFNYIGGKGWTSIPDNIIKIIEYYILYTYQQINSINYKGEEIKAYSELKNEFTNISNILLDPLTYIKDIDSKLKISINLSDNPQTIKSLWSRIYSNIFNLHFCNDVEKGDFNYDSEIDRYQLRASQIKKGVLVDYDLIECEVKNCVLVNCRVYNCEINNSRVINTVAFEGCDFINCFLVDCDIEQECLIEDSTYVNKTESVFMGDAKNSLIKYCDISNNCEIDKLSVILNKNSNESLYRDDDTLEDMSFYNSLI